MDLMRRATLIPILALSAACAPRHAAVPSAVSPVAEVLLAGGPEGESAIPTDNPAPARAADTRPALATVAIVPSARLAAAIEKLRDRQLTIPVEGVDGTRIEDSFTAARDRGERQHNAVDILAPRNTPVVAADDGVILRMSRNALGGITIYAADRDREFVYYYAHLDRYQDGLAEGAKIRKGEVVGYVGTTGNAPKDVPHLHFQIMLWPADGRFWSGEPVNPYPVLRGATTGGGARVRFD